MEHDDHLLSDEEIAALAARIDRSIVLVGMMGVGKTTVGRKLALALEACKNKREVRPFRKHGNIPL